MDLTLNADQRDLQTGLRRYLAGTWTPERLRAAAGPPPAAPVIDRKEWLGLAEMGVFGVTRPERAGGLGLGMADAAILFEELGRALVPGPLVATFLASELGAVPGTDPVTTLDVRDRALIVEHLGSAKHLILAGDAGLFLLPAGQPPGLLAPSPLDPLTPVWYLTATPATTAGGQQIGGPADLVRWRTRGALLVAALQVGVAQGALDLAVGYARERVQFGRVIGSFQAVKHLLAESLVRVELARAAVLAAAVTIDDQDAGGPDEAACAFAVGAAKVLADEAATAGGRDCVQVHGGMGFTWEVLAHLYLKRAWYLQTCFGQSDEHAMTLAEAITTEQTGDRWSR